MRVKRGVTHTARRKALLKKAKGYRWGRKKMIRLARVAVLHAGVHAYKSRKQKKRTNRNLWNIQINAATRELGMSYSVFIGKLKKKKIELDRKVLAEIAQKHPKVFAKIVEAVK